jgi:hypothetical protein
MLNGLPFLFEGTSEPEGYCLASARNLRLALKKKPNPKAKPKRLTARRPARPDSTANRTADPYNNHR